MCLGVEGCVLKDLTKWSLSLLKILQYCPQRSAQSLNTDAWPSPQQGPTVLVFFFFSAIISQSPFHFLLLSILSCWTFHYFGILVSKLHPALHQLRKASSSSVSANLTSQAFLLRPVSYLDTPALSSQQCPSLKQYLSCCPAVNANSPACVHQSISLHSSIKGLFFFVSPNVTVKGIAIGNI